MPSINRLALIRSRFAVLSGNSSLPSVETFRPSVSARHAGTMGGTVFRSNPAPAAEISDLPSDFVAPTVEDFQSELTPELERENASKIAAWTAFELETLAAGEKLLLMG